MSDVARAAGVSTMTVSNVINGRPGASEHTRSRVLAAVAELGYTVNSTARQLRAGRTGAIGLFVPDLDGPYYAHLAARLSTVAESHGYHVLLERTGASLVGELDVLSENRLRPYDGAVFSPVQLALADLEALRPSTPIVLLGERALAGSFDHVMMDNVGGAELATGHLLARGARRVALIGGRREDEVDDMATLRTRGYRRAHEAAGVAVDPRLIVEAGSFGLSDGHEAILGLHRDGVEFDAAFVLTDAAAIGALRALADLGSDVPLDVQVVGFDNDEEGAYAVPRLTTIDPGNDSMAQVIVDLLLQRLGGDGAEPREAVTEARLVMRESTRSV